MLTRDCQAKKGETSGHTKESIASPEKKKGTKEAIVSPEKKKGKYVAQESNLQEKPNGLCAINVGDKVPKQTNGIDCGYFVTKFMKDIVLHHEDNKIPQMHTDEGSMGRGEWPDQGGVRYAGVVDSDEDGGADVDMMKLILVHDFGSGSDVKGGVAIDFDGSEDGEGVSSNGDVLVAMEMVVGRIPTTSYTADYCLTDTDSKKLNIRDLSLLQNETHTAAIKQDSTQRSCESRELDDNDASVSNVNMDDMKQGLPSKVSSFKCGSCRNCETKNLGRITKTKLLNVIEGKMFMTGFSGDMEAAHAKATQLAREAIANMRTIAAFNSETKIVGLFTSNLETPLRRCFWKGQISGNGYGIAQFALYASYALDIRLYKNN
ncbi:hypothetical protein RIF29_15854 [Crotalaria pallida]|uniref:ABC transmembrane type-1 domain-containing protein n=1 Tax=Crotalaria pallida TaxID=3830 RepID=A0AAN9FHV0_CROPI